MSSKKILPSIVVMAVAATSTLLAFAGEPAFEIDRSTIDGGGGMRSMGGPFELSGTIGQHDAGVMSGGDFELTGGFWFALSPTDCNEDGAVDLMDYFVFSACLDGPDGDVLAGCECYDVDHSGTVDLRDFAVAQENFTG